MTFLKANDTISGQQGKAYATIAGVVEEMFYVKDLEATVEKQKTEVKTLGRPGIQNKANGWKGTGSMTIFYTTSRFRQLMLDYIKTGRDTYFDITIVNDDPTSTIGTQTVVLRNCNMDSVIMAKLDTDSETLDEDADFTFDDVDILGLFKAPVLGV